MIKTISTEIGLLKNNGGVSYYPNWCYGDARWRPSTRSDDTGTGEVGGTSNMEFVVLVLPSLPKRTFSLIDPVSDVRSHF